MLGRTLGILTLGVILSGCGSSGFVHDADLRAYTENNKVIGELDMEISLGGLVLGNLPKIPIPHPKNSSVNIGWIELKPSIVGGHNDLLLQLDLTEVSGLGSSAGAAVLPNGTPVSQIVGGIDSNAIIGFPLLGRKSFAYVGIDSINKKAIMGVALIVPQLDSITGKIPVSVNLFPSFQSKNGVRGVFGIFSSAMKEQSGFATFVDASALLGSAPLGIQNLAASKASQTHIVFNDPSQKKSRSRSELENGLMRLSRRGTVIYPK